MHTRTLCRVQQPISPCLRHMRPPTPSSGVAEGAGGSQGGPYTDMNTSDIFHVSFHHSTDTRVCRAGCCFMVGTSQRMSVAPYGAARTRISIAPGVGSVPSSVTARLAAKQAELHALQQLRAESAQLTDELSGLSERIDTLVHGGQSVASVMASWQGVFRAIQIAQGTSVPQLMTAAMTKRDTGQDASNGDENAYQREDALSALGARNVPDTLVRIPIQPGT